PGRVERGKALLSGVELPYPDYTAAESREAAVYVRPHELSIVRSGSEPSLEAKVVHVNPAGSRTKVELWATQANMPINAELTAERYAELQLKSGDTVHVAPRRLHVFDAASSP
ncbi:MAG: TOBE-like domain-containing protein, partial [Polyangiaceae bacterium]